MKNLKITRAIRRKTRTRGNIFGTAEIPRLSVFRSNKNIYAQLIDDSAKKTIIGVTEKHVAKLTGTKVEKSKALGVHIAKLALAKDIKKVIFDRGSYQYHGRVKALAEGAREGVLQF